MPTEMENLAIAAKAKAAEFTADPAKGYAAGYFPDYGAFVALQTKSAIPGMHTRLEQTRQRGCIRWRRAIL